MKKLIRYLLFIYSCLAFSTVFAQSFSMYGITKKGGSGGHGVIYRIDYPSANYTVLVNFSGPNGSDPGDVLTMASNGMIYGVTQNGGTSNYGTIFSFDTTTTILTTLYNFSGPDGNRPIWLGNQASNGLMYGVTRFGGTSDSGVLYSFNPVTNTQTVVFNFHNNIGSYPNGEVIEPVNGVLYGHTLNGGKYGYGVIYTYNINTSAYTVVMDFDSLNGMNAREFMKAYNGLLYGVAQEGGSNDEGVLYSYNTVNNYDSILIDFGPLYGLFPNAVPYQASDGYLYGITKYGGTGNKGLLYRYNENTCNDSIIYNFPAADSCGGPSQDCFFSEVPGKMLCIPKDTGGKYGYGDILMVNMNDYSVQKIYDFDSVHGMRPEGNLLVPSFLTTGVSPINSHTIQVSINPNPSNGKFAVSIRNNVPQIIAGTNKIEIYNILGEQVYSQSMVHSSSFIVDLSSKSSGIYLYRVITETGNLAGEGKLVIQK